MVRMMRPRRSGRRREIAGDDSPCPMTSCCRSSDENLRDEDERVRLAVVNLLSRASQAALAIGAGARALVDRRRNDGVSRHAAFLLGKIGAGGRPAIARRPRRKTEPHRSDRRGPGTDRPARGSGCCAGGQGSRAARPAGSGPGAGADSPPRPGFVPEADGRAG